MELLSEAEDIVGKQPDIHGDTPIEKEQNAAKMFQIGKEKALTISSLLEKAQEKQNEYIHKTLSQEKPTQTGLKKGCFCLEKIPQTIYPLEISQHR